MSFEDFDRIVDLPHLTRFRDIFFARAPLFRKTFLDVQSTFGTSWERDFDAHLGRLFGTNPAAYEQAVTGYAKFSIDAMRLQKLFNKTKKYEDVSYDDASRTVYQNAAYMLDVYLPGIFVSQFLWRHHYRQIQHYRSRFLPLLATLDDPRFYEVGTGTGFYCVQALRHDPRIRGYGIDTSPLSRRFTLNHVNGWGLGGAFQSLDSDIFTTDLEPLPGLQCVEVLEHLPDPVRFLQRLRAMLRPGGYGFIAVAITAPQADHIYLYWEPRDVLPHLDAAGFDVMEHAEEPAYEGAPGEIVPKVAAFLVR
jgi:SAM-dependent methyltransferase